MAIQLGGLQLQRPPLPSSLVPTPLLYCPPHLKAGQHQQWVILWVVKVRDAAWGGEQARRTLLAQLPRHRWVRP